MAHGFAAMRALRLAAYAERFAESGFAVLVFDYRGWGDSAGEPRRVLEIGSQQDDWRDLRFSEGRGRKRLPRPSAGAPFLPVA